MLNILAPDISQPEAIAALSTTLLAFLAHFFITGSKNFSAFFAKKYPAGKASARQILAQRLLGVVLFGFFPAGVLLVFFDQNLSAYGVKAHFSADSAWLLLAFSALILPINYIASQKPSNLAKYPQIKSPVWSKKLIVVSAAGWVAYLFAYELMFRGVLLFAAVRGFGFWEGIAINVTIYSLVHVPKGAGEAIGAIPLGIVLCLATIANGTIWVAVGTHIVLALTNEWFSLQNRRRKQTNN